MKWLTTTNRISLALLGTTAFAVSAVPYFSASALAGGDAGDTDETTISVRTSGDSQPTVIHVPDLKSGETRTYTTDSGKTILLTRSDDGIRLKMGEKETFISDSPGDEGEEIVVHGSGDGTQKKVIILSHGGSGTEASPGNRTKVIVSGKGNAYAFHTGSGEGRVRTSADLLKGRNLKSLDSLDARTRQAVLATLDELLAEGVFIAPLTDFDLPGENGVQVQVERKGTRR
jgi:hypothetical protein